MSTSAKIVIPASDKIDLALSQYFYDDKLLLHRRKINDRNKPLGISDLSYRIINHWENSGLIDVDRGNDGTGWRKFSAMDAIWTNLIVELRKFGVSIENIKKIKDQLTANNDKYAPSVYPVLEFYSSLFMRDKEETYILVPDNFVVTIAVQSEINKAKRLIGMCNHISISLHDIIKTVFKKNELDIKQDSSISLSDDEFSLLYSIRTGAYRSISVKMLDGKINRLEKDLISTEKQIHKLLGEKRYDTITIERENGEIVNIKQIVKEKF